MYASKAYVLHLFEALAEELRDTGVSVTALCPGVTETGFMNRAGMEGSKLFKGGNVMDARTVAEIGYRGLMRGDRVVIAGLKNKLLVQSMRFEPRRLTAEIIRRMQAT